MIRRLSLAMLLSAVFLFTAGYSKIEVTTADNIVRLVKERIAQVQSFSGRFVYTLNGKVNEGNIQFKSPNKFVMQFTTSDTQIISDGKVLWLVFKGENVAISETLDKDKNTPMVGWNITRLLKEYVATFPKTGHQITYKDKPAFKLTFIPRSNTSGFRFINMTVSTNGDILEMDAVNQLGNNVRLAVSYYSFNTGVADKQFEYEPDENTQIYENLLLPRENKSGEEN